MFAKDKRKVISLWLFNTWNKWQKKCTTSRQTKEIFAQKMTFRICDPICSNMQKKLAFRIFPLRCFMFVSSGTKANTCVLHCCSTYIPNYIACAKIQKQVSYLDRRGDRHDRATAWPHKIECSYSKKDWRPTKSQISKGFKWSRSSHSTVVDINVYYEKTIL